MPVHPQTDIGVGRQPVHDLAQRILGAITGVEPGLAGELLERAGGRVKVAAVMQALGLDARAAEDRLAQMEGLLRRALEPD